MGRFWECRADLDLPRADVMKQDRWIEKVTSILSGAADKKYVLGIHDCFTVACEVVNAQLGTSFGEDLRGKYSTVAGSIACIKQHGATLEEAGTNYFGLKLVDVRMARRGDICLTQTQDGMKHFAVCIGERFACLGPNGILYSPMSLAIAAWRVE